MSVVSRERAVAVVAVVVVVVDVTLGSALETGNAVAAAAGTDSGGGYDDVCSLGGSSSRQCLVFAGY